MRGTSFWASRTSRADGPSRSSKSSRSSGAGRTAGQPVSGRGLGELVGDFGGGLPVAAAVDDTLSRQVRRLERQLQKDIGPARGHRRRDHGWAAAAAPLVPYRATSRVVGGLFPMLSANGLAPTGAYLGWDQLSGGSFYVDPVGWVLNNVVTNTNVMTFGKPGMGKSAVVKMTLLRMIALGVRAFIPGDLKDEYEALCRALGVQPIAIGHGMQARINPFDFGPLGAGWDRLSREEIKHRQQAIFARWMVLLRGLLAASSVHVDETAKFVLSTALEELTGWDGGATTLRPVTAPALWKALRDPSEHLVRACRYENRQRFIDETRQITDALGNLVHGSLAGLFDAETNVSIDWDAPIQSFSLRRLYGLGDEVVGIALACMNSWSTAINALRRPGDVRLIIRDEVWRQMRLGLGAVESLDGDLRLSRDQGAIQWMNLHKPSDLLSVGDAGSRAVNIAKDLMALCDTKVLLGQDRQVGDELGQLLGLGDVQTDWITGWARQRKGRALWLVGDRAFKVNSVMTGLEKPLLNTNNELRPDDTATSALSAPIA